MLISEIEVPSSILIENHTPKSEIDNKKIKKESFQEFKQSQHQALDQEKMETILLLIKYLKEVNQYKKKKSKFLIWIALKTGIGLKIFYNQNKKIDTLKNSIKILFNKYESITTAEILITLKVVNIIPTMYLKKLTVKEFMDLEVEDLMKKGKMLNLRILYE